VPWNRLINNIFYFSSSNYLWAVFFSTFVHIVNFLFIYLPILVFIHPSDYFVVLFQLLYFSTVENL